MAKQTAMSLQARRARPFVETGIALATAGILVAVPAIAPPLTARDAQVAAEAHKALSTAQVNLAALSDALLAFQGGGPVNAVLAGIAAALTAPSPATGTMTLAAQREAAGTPVTSVRGLFGRNAEANTGRSFVDLATPSLAGRGSQSDPTIEANAPKPFRDALPKPLKAVEPDAPAVDAPKAPVTAVRDKINAGTKRSGEGNGLVRNSLQFKPDTTLWGDGESGGGGGGPLQGIKDAIGKLTGGGGLKGGGKG